MIGLVHSYLIWIGDILVLYAQCGLLLYFFRNLRPRTLLIAGNPVACCPGADRPGLRSRSPITMKAAAQRVKAQKKAGQTPSPQDERLHRGVEQRLQHIRRTHRPAEE